MSNEEPTEGKCNAHPTQDGGYCALPAGYDTDHFGEGKCKFHGGRAPGAEEGNNHAEKHGLYSQRSNYYANRPAEEKAWIDALVESMMEDAPFTKDNFQKFQMVRNIAIDMHKIRNANDYTEENGMIEENVVRDEEGNPIMRDGELLTEADESPVNVVYDRLTKRKTKEMKELGLLDDPDSKNAKAKQDIATELAAIRESKEQQ